MYDLDAFDYNKVLDIVAQNCVSEVSMKRMSDTEPSCTGKDLDEMYSKLAEVKKAIENGLLPVLKKIHDTRPLVERAKIKNNHLSVKEIGFISENIVCFGTQKKLFSDGEAATLFRVIKKVRVPHIVTEKIDSAIDKKKTVRDDATPELFELNRKLKETRREIEKTMEGYLTSPETGRFIRDKHVTIKDDRYVIPIKHNFKGRIPGIIHAQSGSGETLFLEPFSITDKNNEIKLLQKQKENEIRKILIAVTETIGKNAGELNHILDVLVEIDVILAKHLFMKEYRCCIPQFSADRQIVLRGARHPLLKEDVVPVDFEMKSPISGVVITGPNTGGKSVSLKTIGLFVMLAQSGFPVPADEMVTFLFDSVFADIGDEGSIEQSLSTFSGHIKNIREIVDGADKNSLVLIDELGAGTDPVEGGAIGTAILDYLVSRSIPVVVTTHFSIVKMYALTSERITVASVQFNPATCRPTYKLVMGIPGRSNALEIAEQLGLKREILDKTLEFVSEKDRSFDAIFKNLGTMELKLSRKELEITKRAERLGKLKQEYDTKLEALLEKERFIKAEYRREFTDLISGFSSRLENSVMRIREEGASRESIKNAKDEIEKIKGDFHEYGESRSILDVPLDTADRPPLKKGDYVLVNSDYWSRVRGRIKEIDGNRITVQAGLLSVTVDAGNVDPDLEKNLKSYTGWDYELSGRDPGGFECDIRGKRYEEAKIDLQKFLDNAVLKNVDTISIIHGTGTGALRGMVQETLKNCSFVDHFEYAVPEQGGFGCTTVKFKN